MPTYSLLFAILYFVQGGLQAYQANFQKPLLDHAGISISRIAFLSSVLLLPFVFKAVFGLISDRWAFLKSHRKSYMVLGLALATMSFFSLAKINPSQSFYLFSGVLFATAVGMALFDTSTDGLAIDITQRGSQGFIQTSMMLGRSIGFILFSYLFGLVIAPWGYSSVFVLQGLLTLAILVYVIFGVTEKNYSTSVRRQFTFKSFYKNAKPSFLLIGLFSILYSIPSFGIDGLIALFLQKNFLFNASQLGHIGSLRGIGGIAGTLLAGLSIYKLGIKTTSYGATALLSICGFAFIFVSGGPETYVVTFLWGVFWAFQETLVVSLCMIESENTMAATFFATLMMLSNLGTMLGEWSATALISYLEFTDIFKYFALGNSLLILLLYMYFKNKKLLYK